MSERSGAGVRAIDHVGLTVPDIEEAARFFTAALGAEPLYEMAPSKPATEENLRLEQAQLGTRPGTRWRRALMMRLGDGPCIELFDYEDPNRRPAVTATDLGVQHFAIYVDDIGAVRDRMTVLGTHVVRDETFRRRAEAMEALVSELRARTASDEVLCWGENLSGQLPDGDTSDHPEAVSITFPP